MAAPVTPRRPAAAGPAGRHLLTPGEVAELFGVDPKTVTRWARTGRLPAVRTLGGHRRFPADVVARCLAASGDR